MPIQMIKKGIWVLIIICIILVLAATGLAWYYFVFKPAAQPTPQNTATPSEQDSIDRMTAPAGEEIEASQEEIDRMTAPNSGEQMEAPDDRLTAPAK